MGFTRGSDYTKERTFEDVISDEELENALKRSCRCKPQDNNNWYIRDDTHKWAQCRKCGSTVE
jgi:hypothetical protein